MSCNALVIVIWTCYNSCDCLWMSTDSCKRNQLYWCPWQNKRGWKPEIPLKTRERKVRSWLATFVIILALLFVKCIMPSLIFRVACIPVSFRGLVSRWERGCFDTSRCERLQIYRIHSRVRYQTDGKNANFRGPEWMSGNQPQPDVRWVATKMLYVCICKFQCTRDPPRTQVLPSTSHHSGVLIGFQTDPYYQDWEDWIYIESVFAGWDWTMLGEVFFLCSRWNLFFAANLGMIQEWQGLGMMWWYEIIMIQKKARVTSGLRWGWKITSAAIQLISHLRKGSTNETVIL